MYSYKQKDQKKYMKKSIIITIVAVFVVVATVIGAGVYLNVRNTPNDEVKPRTPTVKYAPATPAEKQQATDAKDKIVAQKNNTTTTPDATSTSDGKKNVTPTITNTNGSVNAFVAGIFEDGGTCTATFKKDSNVLTKSSTGFENVSYTQCAPIDLGGGFLSAGIWSVTVSYSSSTATGVSASQTMEVK